MSGTSAVTGTAAASLRTAYGRRTRWFFVFCLFLLALLAGALSVGAVPVPLRDIVFMVVSRVTPAAWDVVPMTWSATHEQIIMDIRMPRVVLAALVGAALAGAGAAFQGMFRNPMADPYVLGVSGGAALGAVLMMFLQIRLTFAGFSAVPVAAFAGGLITVYTVYTLARTNGRIPVMTLLLSGIAVAAFLGALVSLVIYLAADRMPPLVYWLMGSLANASWLEVRTVFLYILPMLVVLSLYARDLNALLLGEESAHHLGVNPEAVKRVLLVAGTLLTASAVSVSGLIGFVGLIVPHAVRLITGPDHRILVPAAALGGAALLVICDALARTIISPTEIPVGILTAMAGGPFFLYLLRRRSRHLRGFLGSD